MDPLISRSIRRRSRGPRRGLSLLEVIFAIAILGAALAAVGRLVQLGMRSGGMARAQSLAQILADARMSEIACGALPLESNSGVAIAEAPGWQYSVQVQPAEQIGLLVVRVTVEQATADRPTEFSLFRFMPDPNFEFEDPNAKE
jgi:type II secretion system protein I